MKIIVRVILVAAAATLAFWLWTILFPGPEKIIRKQLTGLAHTVSFSQDENDLLKMASAEGVADFFSTNVEVDITIPGHEQQSITGHDGITQAALLSRQAVASLAVKFPDVNVTVAPDKNSATADVTVEADVSGEHDAVFQEVKFTFVRENGHWLISKLETVRVLS